MNWLFSFSLGGLAGLLFYWYAPDPLSVEKGSADKKRIPFHQYFPIKQFAASVAPVLERVFPSLIAKLDRQLVEAGRPDNGVRAAHFLAALYFPALLIAVYAMVFAALGIQDVKSMVLTSILAFAVLAFCGPLWIKNMRDKRKRRLDQQFPGFLDFVLMMKEAGETLAASLRLYVLNNPGLELTEHIRRVVAGIETHKDGLPGAVMEFHNECASELGQTTLLSILKAEEMGARSAAMLRDVATDMRERRYEDAEKIAESLKARSMAPAVLMFMGAFLMLLAGSLGKMFTSLGG
ncbi:type II secretion system F family protein [Rhizobium sp. L1K21]|uniref:type II secretion system F family protein n=1 Tax=Rhizobium sp. L1K21 TaxID=2954933 RepID=UPI002093681F|nr:type II secretion system F family protein [Rhizobium sp. L1K21]MCO6188234.1 type II secretion system F family protein [Rhizobium sp. L1K21]